MIDAHADKWLENDGVSSSQRICFSSAECASARDTVDDRAHANCPTPVNGGHKSKVDAIKEWLEPTCIRNV